MTDTDLYNLGRCAGKCQNLIKTILKDLVAKSRQIRMGGIDMKTKSNRYFKKGKIYCLNYNLRYHYHRRYLMKGYKTHCERRRLKSPYYVDKHYGVKNAWRNCKRANHYFLHHPRELYKNFRRH